MCIEKKKGWDGLGDNTLQREFILQDVDNSQEGVENFSSKYICLLFFFAAECRRHINITRPNATERLSPSGRMLPQVTNTPHQQRPKQE